MLTNNDRKKINNVLYNYNGFKNIDILNIIKDLKKEGFTNTCIYKCNGWNEKNNFKEYEKDYFLEVFKSVYIYVKLFADVNFDIYECIAYITI